MSASSETPAPRRFTLRAEHVVMAAALIVLALAPAAVVLLLRHGSGGGVEAQRLAVARLPTDVATDAGTVWVASGRDDRVLAIDASHPSGRVLRHQTGGAPPRGAAGARSGWAGHAPRDSGTRLHPPIPPRPG